MREKETEEEYRREFEKDLAETEVIRICDDDDGLSETTAIQISDLDQKDEEPENPSEPPAPKKKSRKLKPAVRMILRLILVASLCTAVYSGFQLYIGNKTYREGMNAYSKLADDNNRKAPEAAVTDEGEEVEYTPADFEALAKINPAVNGWITLPGTEIDYPIVQGPDNEYYLEHLFTGETNHTGCVFIDVNNKPDFSDRSSMLYAHHMRNGSMFSAVEDFRKEGFLEEHPYFVLQTPDGVYKIEPFADVLGDAYSTYNRTSFEDDADFLAFVDELKAGSTFRTDTEITAEDRIVGLSTCRYDASEGRYALFGKLIKVK